VLAYLALVALVLTAVDRRFAIGAVLSLLGILVMNREYYRFFYRTRGAWFALRVWPMHVLHHLCNGLSFAIGTVLFLAAHHLRLRLPHSLATDPWSGPPPRALSAVRATSFDQTDSARS